MTPELWLTPAMWLVSLFAEFVIMALLLIWTIWKRIKAERRVRELEEGMLGTEERVGECAGPTPQHEKCTGLIQWEPGDWTVRRCFCRCHDTDTDYTPARRAEQLLTGQEA